MNAYQNLLQSLRTFKAKCLGIEIGNGCLLSADIIFRKGIANSTPGAITVGDSVRILEGAILDAWGGRIAVGKNTFIGPYTVIYGHGGVSIGEDCLIAEHCSIHSANHTIPDQERKIRWEADQKETTRIGNDVWLGAGCRILAGVTIGDGCVIGAGAVVTKDLEPYSIAVGVPANVTRMRDKRSAD